MASGFAHAAGATGNALGAWLGGLAITAGVSFGSVSLIAAVLAAAGLAVALFSGLLDRLVLPPAVGALVVASEDNPPQAS